MEMINHNKIVDFLHNDLKCALVGVEQEHIIVVKSDISATGLKRLIELSESSNYSVYYSRTFNGLVITPRI